MPLEGVMYRESARQLPQKRALTHRHPALPKYQALENVTAKSENCKKKSWAIFAVSSC